MNEISKKARFPKTFICVFESFATINGNVILKVEAMIRINEATILIVNLINRVSALMMKMDESILKKDEETILKIEKKNLIKASIF